MMREDPSDWQRIDNRNSRLHRDEPDPGQAEHEEPPDEGGIADEPNNDDMPEEEDSGDQDVLNGDFDQAPASAAGSGN